MSVQYKSTFQENERTDKVEREVQETRSIEVKRKGIQRIIPVVNWQLKQLQRLTDNFFIAGTNQ